MQNSNWTVAEIYILLVLKVCYNGNAIKASPYVLFGSSCIVKPVRFVQLSRLASNPEREFPSDLDISRQVRTSK